MLRINALKYHGLIFSLLLSTQCYADVSRLQKAYPEFIQAVTEDMVIWRDGTTMPIYDGKDSKNQQEKLDNPSLFDHMDSVYYIPGISESIETWIPKSDPGRIRYEPLFRKMYGNTPEEVESHVITMYWMPKVFGMAYPLQVTTVNHVDQKLIHISNEMEMLVFQNPEYRSFLENPGGTFCWRVIANTNRLSPHSFGMTIDINPTTSDYWQWDLLKAGEPITETAALIYRNHVPHDIVSIFERYGFIWGGQWVHYDSMHFEYRPELFVTIPSEAM
jgi:peptidoglycan L-alanyl-D-glutamate endopeptidase CwlK